MDLHSSCVMAWPALLLCATIGACSAEKGGNKRPKEEEEPPGIHRLTLCVAFAPDGTIVASGHGDNAVRLWDVRNGKEIAELKGESKQDGARVSAVDISPDGQTIASGGGGGAEILVWDRETKQVKHKPKVDGLTGVRGLKFTADGKKLIGWGFHHPPVVFDIATGKKLFVMYPDLKRPFQITVAPDRKTVAVVDAKLHLTIWDVEKQKKSHSFAVTDNTDGRLLPGPLAFTPDSRQVATRTLLNP